MTGKIRLYDYKEKTAILRNCFKLKESTYFVSENYSQQLRFVRSSLWNSCFDERKKGIKARLHYDKLILDGKCYPWYADTGPMMELAYAEQVCHSTPY